MSRSKAAAAVALVLLLVAAPASVGGATTADLVTLELKVVDSAGNPVSGADLTVSWDGGSATETTRANGKALFDVPDGSNPTVAVDHDVYMRNHPYQVENASSRVEEIPVSRSGTLSITVNGTTGPVQGANVQLVRDDRTAASARTATDGTANLGPVEQGTYALRVSKPGYVTSERSYLIQGSSVASRTIQSGAVQLRFNVTDDYFSPPRGVENATVEISQLGTTLRTLENGQATTSVPVNREYDVTISKDGYQTVEQSVAIVEQARVVGLTLDRTPEISLAAANDRVVVGETTRVTVTDEYGDPVEGASVSVGDTSAGTTDAEGVLELTIESEGNVTVSASTDGLSATYTVEGIEPGAETTANPTATSPTTTGSGGPGFTGLSAALALAGAALVLLARRA